jgi:hypothetical protein
MNPALAMPRNLGAVHVGEMLALPGLRSAHRGQRLSGQAEEVIRTVAGIVDELVSATIEKRTAIEFWETQQEVFPKYFKAVRSLSDLARIVIPRHLLGVLMAESFSEREAEFRDHGLEAFGAAVRDQAMFTIWTLRKISDLCQRIDQAKLDPTLQDSDRELFGEFTFHAISARFYLDCLTKSMDVKRPLFPDVLEVVINGLRNAVNAYAWARRAFELRVPRSETENLAVEWDDEDRELLNEATHDMIPETL